MKKILISLSALVFMILGPWAMNASAAPVRMADGQLFDAAYYAQNNPDVVAAFGTNTDWLYLHYVICGKAEGRLPYAQTSDTPGAPSSGTDFDPVYYAAKYPDVAAVFGNDPALLRMHYDTCGKAEGRFPNAAAENGGTPAPAAVTVAAPAVSDSGFEMQVLELVNAERAKYGLAPLAWDPVNLGPGAAVRAREISSVFSHTRPDGTSCFTAVSNPGALGENIAAGQRTPQQVMNSWMNSSGHRANILNAAYTRLGVGYYYASSSPYGHYWVQMFSS